MPTRPASSDGWAEMLRHNVDLKGQSASEATYIMGPTVRTWINSKNPYYLIFHGHLTIVLQSSSLGFTHRFALRSDNEKRSDNRVKWKKKLHNVTHLTLYIAHLIAITTGFQLFAVCQRHTANIIMHMAKSLLCVAHGKQHTAYSGRQSQVCRVLFWPTVKKKH